MSGLNKDFFYNINPKWFSVADEPFCQNFVRDQSSLMLISASETFKKEKKKQF